MDSVYSLSENKRYASDVALANIHLRYRVKKYTIKYLVAAQIDKRPRTSGTRCAGTRCVANSSGPRAPAMLLCCAREICRAWDLVCGICKETREKASVHGGGRMSLAVTPQARPRKTCLPLLCSRPKKATRDSFARVWV